MLPVKHIERFSTLFITRERYTLFHLFAAALRDKARYNLTGSKSHKKTTEQLQIFSNLPACVLPINSSESDFILKW